VGIKNTIKEGGDSLRREKKGVVKRPSKKLFPHQHIWAVERFTAPGKSQKYAAGIKWFRGDRGERKKVSEVQRMEQWNVGQRRFCPQSMLTPRVKVVGIKKGRTNKEGLLEGTAVITNARVKAKTLML